MAPGRTVPVQILALMTPPSDRGPRHGSSRSDPGSVPGPPKRRRGRFEAVRSTGGSALGATRRRLETTLGGSDRTFVIVTLAAVLALSSADTSTVGAAASELRQSLHIDNTDIGLLVSVSAAVGAVASVPFGILVDRVRRTTLLSVTIATWGVAMIASSAVSSFGDLLLVRVFLGFVTAVAGPAVASLVGDYFPGQERGTIYGYILTGELVGGGVGFFITGDVAAISWRAAFVLLAVPAFAVSWQLRKLTEPPRAAKAPRGGRRAADAAGGGPQGGFSPYGDPLTGRPDPANEEPSSGPQHGGTVSDVQQMARDAGVMPDTELILRADPRRMGIFSAARYVLKVRTNVVLIISSACAYFFLTGVQTFGLEFVGQQYGVGTFVATLMMLAIGAGAVLGVLVGGRAGDAMVKRGRIDGRMLVAGVAAMATVLLFIPPLLTTSAVTALPYIAAAGFFLTAQNPTLDAARLDIMPPLLWGRAEGIRTLLRSAAQAVAPLVFGGLADVLSSTHHGFRYTFLIMLLPLAASGVILLRGLRFYPADVATAAASASHERGAGDASHGRRYNNEQRENRGRR